MPLHLLVEGGRSRPRVLIAVLYNRVRIFGVCALGGSAPVRNTVLNVEDVSNNDGIVV